jgi:ubiquinol-cytochrome c reductase iron-sulfur subunit
MFLAAAASAVAFSVVFWWNSNTQLEGVFIGISFLLLAGGLVLWSHRLMPEGPFEEEYPELRSPAETEAEAVASMDRGGIRRRRVLIGSVGVVGASLTAGLVSSLRSLGPAPYSLGGTPWRGGRVVVTSSGDPVRADGIPVGAVASVFPKGFIDNPQTQAMLIHLPPRVNRPLPGRESWAPDGFVCYSKVCSHAGCPVNLYNRTAYELTCPCHQSTFDVPRGAEPVFGPAGGPLPQLPLTIAADGTLRSTGDFSGPPGPVYWHRT